MIALLNLLPESARAAGVELLDTLPEPPAVRWSGFLIHCDEHLTIDDVMPWCSAVRRGRPALPIGIVTRPDPDVLRTIAVSGIILDPVLMSDDLTAGGRINSKILDGIREVSIEARVVERWLLQYGNIAVGQLPVLHTLAAHAVRGERIKSVETSIDYSLGTLTRRLRKLGYPPPGILLRDGRIASVQIRVEMGVDPRLAREAAGWYSAEMYARARKRFRDDVKWGE